MAGVEAGGERARVAEPAREVDRLLGERQPAIRVARVVELEREPRQQPRAQRAVLVAERRERLLEQRQPRLVDAAEHRPLAGVAERRAAEQRRVAQHARRGGGGLERGPRRRLHAGAVLGGALREQQLGAHRILEGAGQLARAQRRAVVLRGLLPGELAVGAARGGEREVDRALGLLDRGGLREVVGELRQVRIEVGAAQARDRLADAAVQARPAQLRQPVVERRAHERVRERVAADAPGLAQHARLDALLQRADQRVLLERGDRLEHVVVELAPDHGGDLERLARLRVAAAAGAAR